jgi:hypothetical protein
MEVRTKLVERVPVRKSDQYLYDYYYRSFARQPHRFELCRSHACHVHCWTSSLDGLRNDRKQIPSFSPSSHISHTSRAFSLLYFSLMSRPMTTCDHNNFDTFEHLSDSEGRLSHTTC